MGIPYVKHGTENCIGGRRVFNNRIGKHATVPANVVHATIRSTFQPVAGCRRDIQLTVGIIRLAVPTRFIVRAGSMHCAIVLATWKS